MFASTSTFRDLPAAQIPVLAPPDRATQQLMITRTINFLNETIPELPNFFANRTTVHYEETPPRYEQAGEPGIGYEPLHVKSKSVDTVLYRDGHEVATGRRTGDQKAEESHELTVGGILARSSARLLPMQTPLALRGPIGNKMATIDTRFFGISYPPTNRTTKYRIAAFQKDTGLVLMDGGWL